VNLKESLITPIQKVTNSIKCQNLRPINSLPTEEKILEKIVKNQLERHVECNGLLAHTQSGFRAMYSCETALNYVIEEWKGALDCGNYVVAVFVDETRAFETLDRSILIDCLQSFGVRATERRWFESYLNGRTQRVRFNGHVSDSVRVDIGVPQGSVLAPLLFLLYVNDIQCVLGHCRVKLFADDTLIYCIGKELPEVMRKVSEDLDNFYKWLNFKRLKANADKTKFMILKNRNKLADTQGVQLSLGDRLIERVFEFKYLGVVIDHNMTFKSNGLYVCGKIGKKVSFLGRVAKKVPKFCREIIYNSIVAPYFNYCSSVLFLSDNEVLDCFQRLQNRAMRVVLGRDRYASVTAMLAELEWLSVRQRLTFNTLVLLFKVKNGLAPQYLGQHVNYVGSVTGRTLRNNGDFRIAFRRSASGQNSIFCKGLRIYNSLSVELKNETSLSVFKRKIYMFVSSNF
jgi:hypothetical protein